MSSLTGAVLPSDTVYFGEISLSGAVRPVVHAGLRLKEAAKLGFRSAVAPPAQREGESAALATQTCAHISSLVAEIAAIGAETRRVAGRGRA